MEKKKSGLTESFIIGVIALVFLIVGYQTALFVHNAAVTAIVAGRDEPDTVYVYEAEPSVCLQDSHSASRISVRKSATSDAPRTVRQNASHAPRVEAVRSKVPRRHVESFRFDPNTASAEDLCRLGFTQKQAASIVNYRLKGGRFRRKEDFARSFVVSDSVYRRLEPYIDIPLLDLNIADSAAFDALPGIGGWFASRMVAHRKALCGYSCKEQLMDIWKFDEERYDALKDLITVSSDYVTPYPLWSYPADSLRRHPYIRNYETARAIVLFRDNNPRDRWTVAALSEAGILSPDNAARLSRCIISPP